MADIHEFIKPACLRNEIGAGDNTDAMIRKLHDQSWAVRADAMRCLMRYSNNLRVMVEDAAVHNGDEAFLPTEAASGGLARLVFFIAGAVIGAIVGVML